MIIIKNRELIIPNSEYNIGTVNDNNTETRLFKIDRITSSGTDIANLTFTASFKKSNGTTASVAMTKEIHDDYLLLLCTFTANVVSSAGALVMQISGYSDTSASATKWNSYPGTFYVESATQPEDVTWSYKAESWAVGTKDGADVPESDVTYHNNAEYYATQASNSATSAASSATSAATSAATATTKASEVTSAVSGFETMLGTVTLNTDIIKFTDTTGTTSAYSSAVVGNNYPAFLISNGTIQGKIKKISVFNPSSSPANVRIWLAKYTTQGYKAYASTPIYCNSGQTTEETLETPLDATVGTYVFASADGASSFRANTDTIGYKTAGTGETECDGLYYVDVPTDWTTTAAGLGAVSGISGINFKVGIYGDNYVYSDYLKEFIKLNA